MPNFRIFPPKIRECERFFEKTGFIDFSKCQILSKSFKSILVTPRWNRLDARSLENTIKTICVWVVFEIISIKDVRKLSF